MSWKNLLQPIQPETIILPWVGGRQLHCGQKTWKLEGKLPEEYGWCSFLLNGRKATFKEITDPFPESITVGLVNGFLIGDRIIPDSAPCPPDVSVIHKYSETVYCLEPGLDRFSRIQAGRIYEGGPLIFKDILFPLGVEDSVQSALLDGKDSISDIPGVPPALEASFQMERWRRQEAEKRRLELERHRREEEERIRREDERQRLYGQLGTAQARRAIAITDFASAARAALAISGAQYLDHSTGYHRNEVVVKFRFLNRRFECVVDALSLAVKDSGVCLTDESTGEKGDTWLTLESLPMTIKDAHDQGRLVVFRHV